VDILYLVLKGYEIAIENAQDEDVFEKSMEFSEKILDFIVASEDDSKCYHLALIQVLSMLTEMCLVTDETDEDEESGQDNCEGENDDSDDEFFH